MLGALNQSRLTGIAGRIQPIKNMMNAVRGAKNPQAMMEQMMRNNPQFQQVNQLIQQSGGDAKKAFYTFAEQQGIDPEQIVQMLNGIV